MPRVLRVANELLYEKMERRSVWRSENGSLSWNLLPWLLLALLFAHGGPWMDEPPVDGSICRHYFWRKDVAKWYMDCKDSRHGTGYCRRIDDGRLCSVFCRRRKWQTQYVDGNDCRK